MNIKENVQGDVAVLRLTGTMMHGPEVAPFHDRIKALVEKGTKHVVCDFSGAEWCGSAMLGVLVAGLSTARNASGDIRLAGVLKRIRSVFVTTQMDAIFKTFENVDEAVASFASDPPKPAEA